MIFPDIYLSASEVLASQDRQVLLLLQDKKVLGFVVVHQWVGRKTAETEMVGIAESARGKGFGRSMLSSAISQLLEEGMESIQLIVDADNEAALSLYLSLGYQVKQMNRHYLLK